MISVIIPTFNRAQFLEKAISTILTQPFELEIIIIDDGSTDDTASVVMDFNNRNIQYVKLSRTGNIGRLRNEGIKKSQFDILAFCDDDDFWFPKKLSVQLPLLDKFDIVCSNANLINKEGEIIKNSYFEKVEDFIITPSTLLQDNFVLTPSVVLKKKILKNFRFEDENYKFLCEDYFLWLQIVLQNEIYFTSDPLISVRRHSSITQELDNKINVERNHIKILEPFANSTDKEIMNSARKSILNKKIEVIRIYFNQQRYKSVLLELIKFSLFFDNAVNCKIFLERVSMKIKKFLKS